MTARTIRTLLAAMFLVSAVNIPALLPAPARAAALAQTDPTVITFDDVKIVLEETHMVLLADEYDGLGVTFNNPVVESYRPLGAKTPDFAHSGVKAAHQCESSQVAQCNAPLIITFAEPQRYVGVWVGYSASLAEEAEVMMTAYNAATEGDKVDDESVWLDRTKEKLIPTQYMQVESEDAEIRRVEIGFVEDRGLAPNLVFDDVTFGGSYPTATLGEDEPEPEPCLPETTKPSVHLAHSRAPLVVHENLVTLEGKVTTAQDLIEAAIIRESGGSRQSEPLTPTHLTAQGGAFGPFSVEHFLLPGMNTLTLQATNCAGTSSVQALVEYRPPAEGTHYSLEAIEVTQTVQDPTNRVRLVAGKRTFARVFLATAGSTDTLTRVSAQLGGCRVASAKSTKCLPSKPAFTLQAPSNVVTVDSLTGAENLAARRGNIGFGLLYELPQEWSDVDYLHLWLEESTLSPALWCDGCDNRNADNTLTAVRFEDAPSLTVDFVDVSYTVDDATYVPSETDHALLKSWLQRAYPTNDVEVVSEMHLALLAGEPTCDVVAQTLFADWVKMTYGDETPALTPYTMTPTRYYGLVASQGNEDGVPMRGCALLETKVTNDQRLDNEHFASGPTGTGAWPWDLDASYGDWYGGHELGHTFGRLHVMTCGDSNDEDKNFPNETGLLTEVDDGTPIDYVGFDSGNPGQNIPVRVYRGDKWHDIMTYCKYEWISAYTYGAIWQQMSDEEAAIPTVEQSLPPADEPSGDVDGDSGEDVDWNGVPDYTEDVVLVIGTINLDQGTATLRPSTVLPRGVVTQRNEQGEYRIELRASNETVLATYPFEATPYSDEVAGTDDLAQLSEIVPWVNATRFIDIYRGNGPRLDRQIVSLRAPDVQVTGPNGGERLQGGATTVTWTASDPDGDPLTFDLHYSADGGETWQSLVSGLPDVRQYDVDLSRVPGSEQALFRVMASDGARTAVDESDADFQLPGHAPEVSIISPGTGSRYGTSHTIVLVGEATDIDQGTLDDDSLTWTTADKDSSVRTLGRGRSISVADLTPGRHTITLTARDADGLEAATSIAIRIVDDEPPVYDWAPPEGITSGTLGADGLFFYDNANEEGTFFASDGQGLLSPSRTFDVLLNGWSSVTPGNFGGDSSTDLLFYASELGVGEFYASDGAGGLSLLSGNEGFTKGWDLIAPVELRATDTWSSLLFYDREEGVGKLYSTDGTGKIQLVGDPVPIGHAWTSIVAGQFGDDDRANLLLYDKWSGQGLRIAIDEQGTLELPGEQFTWAAGWDTLVPGQFGGAAGRTDLVLYDAETGNATLLQADGSGVLSVTGIPQSFPGQSDTVVGGSFGANSASTDLFFYNADQGLASVYTIDDQGAWQERGSREELGPGWDQVVPGRFGLP